MLLSQTFNGSLWDLQARVLKNICRKAIKVWYSLYFLSLGVFFQISVACAFKYLSVLKSKRCIKELMSRLAIVKHTWTFARLLTCNILASKLKIRTGWVNHGVGWETGGMFRIKDQGSAIHSSAGNQLGVTFLRGGYWAWCYWAFSPVNWAVGHSAPLASLGRAAAGCAGRLREGVSAPAAPSRVWFFL